MPLPSMPSAPDRLSRNVPMLGLVSLLMGMSSAMIYGVLPVFLVVVLGASSASVGLIEGIAEATTSFVKIFSGAISDRIGRRKPLVVLATRSLRSTSCFFRSRNSAPWCCSHACPTGSAKVSAMRRATRS